MSTAHQNDEIDLIKDDSASVVVVEKTPDYISSEKNKCCHHRQSSNTSTNNNKCDFDCNWDLFDDPSETEGENGDAESGVFFSTSSDNAVLSGAIMVATGMTGHDAVFVTNNDSDGFICAPCGSCPRRTMSFGNKKNVRFADAQGKPLASIVTFANTPIGSYDSSSNTPIASTPFSRALNLASTPSPRMSLFEASNCMEKLFTDPLSDYSVLADKLRTQNIALESVCCRSGFIKGIVRVKNLSFSKKIFVRMTFENWSTFHDWNCDVYSIVAPVAGIHSDYDLFEFSIPLPPQLMPGTIIQFCICYQCDKGEFWDNNYGQNYSLRYHPPASAGKLVSSNSLNNLKSAESDAAERLKRIHEFVAEFNAWSSNTSINLNLSSLTIGPNVKHHVVTPADAVNAPKTTAPAPNCVDSPYW